MTGYPALDMDEPIILDILDNLLAKGQIVRVTGWGRLYSFRRVDAFRTVEMRIENDGNRQSVWMRWDELENMTLEKSVLPTLEGIWFVEHRR